jgi:hypothetical protein
MIGQLRVYTINKGMMEGWLKLFKQEIVPRLGDAGIGVHTVWVDQEHEQFIWIRTFGDRAEIEAKEAAFYGSDWWKTNVERVRGHLARREVTVIEPFLPDGA